MRIFALIAFAAALILPAYAHHGWSSYDASKVIKVTGPALTVKWENPHAEVTMTHEGATWVVVLAPTSRIEARGIQSAELSVGKTLTVEAYPKRDGQKEMRAERVTLEGKTVELR